MIVNKHGSFYMRSGWGTKILHAVNEDAYIFTPTKEQEAIDEIGLGKIMIKALRYWSNAMGLTVELKHGNGIEQQPTSLFDLIFENDIYFQNPVSLLLMHRELVLNKENATAWYWFFNEYEGQTIDKETFTESFHSYLAVNEVKIKKDAVEKEFNCLKNTYVGDYKIDKKSMMDEDTIPFLGPLKILKLDEKKSLVKRSLTKADIPIEMLIYAIAQDNIDESQNQGQISIDYLMEEKKQLGKYFNIRYSKLIEMLLEAENKRYINLNNNFGNRYIEFVDVEYKDLLNKLYGKR